MEVLPSSVLDLSASVPVKASFAGLIESEKPFVLPKQVTPTYELLFVREGVLHTTVDDSPIDVTAGQTLVLRPGETCAGGRPSKDRLRFYFVHFAVKKANHKAKLMQLPRLCSVARPERLTALFRLLLDDQMDQTLECLPAQFLLAQVLAEVAVNETLIPLQTDAASVIMERGKTYIRRNFTSPITTASVAQALDVNPSYFGKAFRKAAGYSATEFIAITRFHVACSALSETDNSIKQISRDCGFEDAAYFSRVFRKRMGMTPREYRRLHGKVYAW